jgi:hypothetical protein
MEITKKGTFAIIFKKSSLFYGFSVYLSSHMASRPALFGFFFSFDRAKRDSNEKKKRVEEDGYSLAGAIMREDKAHHHAKRNYTTQTGNRSNK